MYQGGWIRSLISNGPEEVLMNRDEGDLLFVVVVVGALLYLLSGVLVRGCNGQGRGHEQGK